MKNIITIIIFALMITTSFGQESKLSRDEIKKSINTQLELTDSEANDLWRIHDEFKTEFKKLRQERRLNSLSKKKIDDLSDEELEQMIQSTYTFKEKEIKLRKDFHEKYKKVIPLKKVAKFYVLNKKIRKNRSPHSK